MGVKTEAGTAGLLHIIAKSAMGANEKETAAFPFYAVRPADQFNISLRSQYDTL